MAEAASKTAFEDMHKTWIEMKGLLEQAEIERKAFGTELAWTKEQLEKAQKRLDEAETKWNRPALPGPAAVASLDWRERPECKAFNQMLRRGHASLSAEDLKIALEHKLLSVGDDTTGGYLAPVEYVREIIKGIVEMSPVRTLARIRTTSQRSIQWPVRTGTFAARRVAELGTRTETTGLQYGLKEIPTHEYYAMVDISNQDLEDSAFDLEAELNAEFTEQFGVAEGADFINHTGVGGPEGFMFCPNITVVNSGVAANISADALINLYYGLKTPYANVGTWTMNRATLKAIRTLKDGNGNYIWQPGLALNRPNTILERPYLEMVDMPDIGADTYPVAFGDFRRGYLIVDRLEMSVQRDPFTQAASGAVRFHARKRIGGQVILTEAIQKLKCAA
jgi:HK97 family phage major capsid protein